MKVTVICKKSCKVKQIFSKIKLKKKKKYWDYLSQNLTVYNFEGTDSI